MAKKKKKRRPAKFTKSAKCTEKLDEYMHNLQVRMRQQVAAYVATAVPRVSMDNFEKVVRVTSCKRIKDIEYMRRWTSCRTREFVLMKPLMGTVDDFVAFLKMPFDMVVNLKGVTKQELKRSILYSYLQDFLTSTYSPVTVTFFGNKKASVTVTMGQNLRCFDCHDQQSDLFVCKKCSVFVMCRPCITGTMYTNHMRECATIREIVKPYKESLLWTGSCLRCSKLLTPTKSGEYIMQGTHGTMQAAKRMVHCPNCNAKYCSHKCIELDRDTHVSTDCITHDLAVIDK